MQRRFPGALRRLFVLAVLAATTMLVVAGSGSASSSLPEALIDGSTVAGGGSSVEAQLATAAGFHVTVVSDSTWGSMSASQFGQYDVLIAGDPDCGSLPNGLLGSASTWGQVVLGRAGDRTLAGNRVVVGTDPDFHAGNNPASNRATVIKDGIKFAGAQTGTTGMYFDASCGGPFGQGGQIVSALNNMSEGSGSWSIDTSPPCGGNVSLIASNSSFNDLKTSDLAGWGCSVHESFPAFPSDFSALAVATDTVSHPTCGVDPNTGASACGEAYVLIAGSNIVVRSGSISLDPPSAVDTVGTDHTVTATVTSGDTPLAGQVVNFTVTGQNSGATGTCDPSGCITDANGNVSFTYHDTNGAGNDTIKASFTDARGSLQAATAAEQWIGVVEQPISASGVDVSASEGNAFSGTVAMVSDPDTAATPDEYTASVDWGDGTTSAGTITGSGGNFAVDGDHTYADEGMYTVTTTVTDTDAPDNFALATSTATVVDAPLAATNLVVGDATEGGSPTAVSFSFTDGNASASASDFSATIAWGDGSSSAGTVSGSGGSYTVDASHAYGDEGTYAVSVSVTDVGGSSTGDTGTATVADAPLAATGADSTSAQAFNGTVASFTDGNASAPASDFTATINWGDGSSSTGTVSGSGGSYTVDGSHTYAGTGYYTVKVDIADDGGSTADATSTVLAYGASVGGSFVISGSQSAIGTHVTFWGAQWAKLNPLTSGSAPASFKGFEDSVVSGCGVAWSADPGNSTPPASGPLPAYMAVVVSSSITKSGASIGGNTLHVVVVKTNAGYAPNPGHAGTGTVVATIC